MPWQIGAGPRVLGCWPAGAHGLHPWGSEASLTTRAGNNAWQAALVTHRKACWPHRLPWGCLAMKRGAEPPQAAPQQSALALSTCSRLQPTDPRPQSWGRQRRWRADTRPRPGACLLVFHFHLFMFETTEEGLMQHGVRRWPWSLLSGSSQSGAWGQIATPAQDMPPQDTRARRLWGRQLGASAQWSWEIPRRAAMTADGPQREADGHCLTGGRRLCGWSRVPAGVRGQGYIVYGMEMGVWADGGVLGRLVVRWQEGR